MMEAIRSMDRKKWQPFKFVDEYGSVNYTDDFDKQRAALATTRCIQEMTNPYKSEGESIETV